MNKIAIIDTPAEKPSDAPAADAAAVVRKAAGKPALKLVRKPRTAVPDADSPAPAASPAATPDADAAPAQAPGARREPAAEPTPAADASPKREKSDAPAKAGKPAEATPPTVLVTSSVAKPNEAAAARDQRSWITVLASTTVAILVAFAIGRSGWYTPGDNVGYYVGLAGGVMMLLLLIYPLRKHVAALRTWGPVKYWFAGHMVLGIAGPVLVLAHSTFHMRSTNAAVALICMLIVAASGIVGRFLYVKVHRGLYGEKLNLKELQAKAGFESDEVHSKLHFVPEVEKRLKEFEAYALPEYRSFGHDAWRFVSLGVRRIFVYRACVTELERVMRRIAELRNWDADKYRRRFRRAKALIKDYLSVAQGVSQFTMYDRLLRLWHVAHVPLVYLLVLSAIAHVIAVHMY
jgi:hypothetical protein